MSDPEVLTLDEASALLRMHRNTVAEMFERQEIPANKRGRAWRVLRDDVLAWIRGEGRASRTG